MNLEIKYKPSGDFESGECSEREMKVVKVKKIKRVKKRRSKRKKSSSSESSRSDDVDEFNPYKCAVPEAVELVECELSDCEGLAVPAENGCDAVEEERKPEPRWSCKMDQLVAEVSAPEVRVVMKSVSRLPIDSVGLDGCRNVRGLLRGFGFDPVLVEELIEVLENEHIPVEEEDDVVEQQEQQDGGEDGKEAAVMLREDADDEEAEHMAALPEVEVWGEQGGDRERSYSPEPQRMARVSYAPPAIPDVTRGALQGLLDMGAIPAVGPKDPRVVQPRPRTLPPLPHPASTASPPHGTTTDQAQQQSVEPPTTEATDPNSVLMNPKEWEQRVLDVVKPYLKQYLTHKEISRTEFKSILKRAVTKIIDSGERKLDPAKIGVFVHSYVIITQKTRTQLQQQQQHEHSQGDSD